MKFFVLGSNSFSGSTFIAHLIDQGHDVMAISRSLPPHEAFLPHRWDGRKHIRFMRLDINRDLAWLKPILLTERPTHIVNFASLSMVAESWDNPCDWMQTNVVSTIRLHEMLRNFDWLEKFVHVSTPEVYGSTDGWANEDHPFRPSTPYAVSRAAADMSLRTYHERYGFPVVTTRAANVYGPGQRLYRIIPRAVLAAMGGPKLTLHGGGKSVRVFTHMRDVAAATLKIATYGKPGHCYHISGQVPTTVLDVVERVVQRMGKMFDECVDMGPERPGKDHTYLLSSTKLKIEIGWREMVTLDAGIDEVIAWAMKHRDVVLATPPVYEHAA